MPGQWARNQFGQSRLRRREKGPMNFGLQDRVAIITDASYGIGRAIAESFIQEGMKVARCAYNRE